MPGVERAAYFLDFDGTLVDIAATPEAVRVEPRLAGDLLALRRLCGDAVAIVTGRPVAQVDAFLPTAAYAVAGEHGTALRLRPGAPVVSAALPALPDGWLEAARRLVAAQPGAMLEEKRHGFAVHYRASPAAGPALRAAIEALIAPAAGYTLLAAKMAWEIRPAGIDKGSAVRALMQHAPFAGRLPVFVGDDVTDEDGMRAARDMGGTGLRVDEIFGNPAGVRAWLTKLVSVE